jgi:photosynthetic reaction center cytochrome c subunit
MNTMAAALGVSCGSCHTRGNFASESNPRKAVARRMLEMTKGLNQQFFPDYKPAEGESRIGRVTCYTCHQGFERPKTAPPQ